MSTAINEGDAPTQEAQHPAQNAPCVPKHPQTDVIFVLINPKGTAAAWQQGKQIMIMAVFLTNRLFKWVYNECVC